jgi:predicted AlkP superfamily phosphohydrolase/phosphomutase
MFAGIDWSRTQVFASPHGGQVFINLKGRQPEGMVSPEDYHPLREKIRGILKGLIDPTTGVHVIKDVHFREDIFHGPYSEPAGDLVIEWNIEAIGNALCSPTPSNQISVSVSKDSKFFQGWTGTHRPYGIFIAYGPQIKKGETLSTATQYDITPTILYLQDHPIPNDMDGKVLTDIFTEDHLNQHPIQYSEPPDIQWKMSAEELDADETRKIEERLRGLGYIE